MAPDDTDGEEGRMPVPGGVLHYRVAGRASAADVLVFENGWGALFPYATWLEKALAPHVRLVCYDRAGIGESTSTEPITTARLTEQLLALLAGLGISQPVVAMGHSYGGLIAALHAAQAPQRVRAVIQVDPTPEYRYEEDAALDHAPAATLLTKLAIRLGFSGLVASMWKGLPEPALQRLTRSRAWMIHIINSSLPEIRLFRDIQRVVQASDAGRLCPRLVISGLPPRRAGLFKILLSENKLAATIKSVQEIHRRQAEHNEASRWLSIPYDHYTMLAHRDGAQLIARHALDFLRTAQPHQQ